MKKRDIFKLGIFSFCVALRGEVCAVINPLPTIEISMVKDSADVQALHKALSALSMKVSACLSAGGKPESCQCSEPDLLKHLRVRYNALLKQHPAWKDQILSYKSTDPEGRVVSGTLVMPSLRRQLEMLKCK